MKVYLVFCLNLVQLQRFDGLPQGRPPRARHDGRLNENACSISFGAWMSSLPVARAHSIAPVIGHVVEYIEGIHVHVSPANILDERSALPTWTGQPVEVVLTD
jgi:hypothetical protein